MPTGTCALCQQAKQLRKSHLMPKSLYKKTRWEGASNPNPMLVSRKGAVQISDQTADYVLCGDCEQRLSKRGERYVMGLVDQQGKFPLLDKLRSTRPTRDGPFGKFYDAATTPDIDRDNIAYFALSVFWRAAVHHWKSPGEPSQKIRLGPYAETIRKYLLDEAPYPSDIVLMLTVCTDSTARNSFFSPTRSKKGTSTTHTFNARGLLFFLEAGREMDAHMKQICMMSGDSQWIFVRSCEDKMQIAMNALKDEQALYQSVRSRKR